MTKKKKSQLKPVERGFATSSIPKKAVIHEETNADSSSEATQNGIADKPTSHVQNNNSFILEPTYTQPDVIDSILDKYQDKTNKGVTRFLKSIEFDHVISRTYEKLELFPTHVHSIVALIETNCVSRQVLSEDKTMPRLGMIYGVLRKFGFDEETILQCLVKVDVLDIDSAYEWLCLRSPVGEAGVETTQNTFLKPILSSTANFGFRIHTSMSSSTSLHTLGEVQPPIAPAATTDNLTPSLNIIHFKEYDDPNEEYAYIKARIYDIETSGKGDDHDVLTQLRARSTVIQNDYCFREREAQTLFFAEKSKIDARLLEEKLTGSEKFARNLTEHTPPIKIDKVFYPQPQIRTSPIQKATVNIFENDTLEDESGIFGTLLDGPLQSEVVEGIQIQLQDIARPKHRTGRTAKILLSDVAKKLDKLAVVSYRILPSSLTSIAKRAAVSIRWGDSLIGEWCMEGVGCFTIEQAEEYVSTVALHGIVHQQSDGFAMTSTSKAASTVPTNIQFLPPLLRDLWDDLESQRRNIETTENRRIWSLLYTVHKKRNELDDFTMPKPVPAIMDLLSSHKDGFVHPVSSLLEKDVQELYHSRKASVAYATMLEQRKKLPIASFREEILARIDASRVVVLSGDTGCGKSTQIPSFILEKALSKGNYCKIYCAEPRRISTISLAQRVSAELGDPRAALGTASSLVGYSIRLESNTSPTSRLIFATYGIILRLLERRRTTEDTVAPLDDVTHIIIDEVHERNLDSDFLLIILKSLLETNKALRVILMSATLNAQKISEYFNNCPVITVPGRTFSVDVQFLEDAVELTKWTIDEDSPLARRDEGHKHTRQTDEVFAENNYEVEEQIPFKLDKCYSQGTRATVSLLDERQIPYELILRLLERLCFEEETLYQFSRAILVFMPGLAEIRRLHDILFEHPLFGSEEEFHLFPLHSTMTNEQQSSVFDLLPVHIRKIVISTNIAETGVTIPDITCVIDTGRHREMRYDEKRQISRLVDTFITVSNAKQRRGRAGRVQPGLCFHLFTKFRFDYYMSNDPTPEMSRLSLSSIALKIKTLNLNLGGSIEDVLSRALDPPLEMNVQRAVQALIEAKVLTPNQDVTPMGKILSRLPTDIHLGKVLLSAVIFECLDSALTIVASLNSKSPFIAPFGMEQQARKARQSFQIDNSDFLTIDNAFASWRRTCSDPSSSRKFCSENFLNLQTLQQIEDLRQQFFGYLIESGFIKLSANRMDEFSKLRAGKNQTRFVTVPSELNRNSSNSNYINAALVFGLYPKLLSIDSVNGQLRTFSHNQVAHFHTSSINMGKKLTGFSELFLCYFTIMRSRKLYAWETGPVDNLALALLCGDCEFKPFVGGVVIDHKIKFKLTPRACVTLKHLRQQLQIIINSKFRSSCLKPVQIEWLKLALSILSGVRPDEFESEHAVGQK